MILETVEGETPALRATSFIVIDIVTPHFEIFRKPVY